MTDTDLLEMGEGTAWILALPLVLANTNALFSHLDWGYTHSRMNKTHLSLFCARITQSSDVVYDMRITKL